MDNPKLTTLPRNPGYKTTSWIAFAFYFLIAFEFFYMVTPFAVYFYSVYNPALDLFSSNPLFLWLNQTFLPHVVAETKSPLLNQLHAVGGTLFLAGCLLFLIGATQVYYHKLFRKREVTGGLYRWARHPQYTGLMIAGLGLLLLWPRFIVLIAYLSMLFVYFFLARIEERECLAKFGKAYADYREITPMFLPWFRGRSNTNINHRPLAATLLRAMLLYILIVMSGTIVAAQIKRFSISQLYAVYSDDYCAISLTNLDKGTIRNIVTQGLEALRSSGVSRDYPGENHKGIIYLVPANWEVSEIPMHVPAEAISHMHRGRSKKISHYRVVFTQAAIPEGSDLKGKAILDQTKSIDPVLEVIFGTEANRLVDMLPPVDGSFRNSTHLPLF